MAKPDHPEPIPRIIPLLSSLLERTAESNDMNRRFDMQKISAFQCLSRPNISIESYLERIFRYASCSPSCFVVAYVYLDRFSQRQPLLPINSFNVHRLLITSVLVSAKFMDDVYFNNAYYAKIGGISTREMNILELDFLFGLGFQLNVTPSIFHAYYCHLQREILQDSPLNLAISTHLNDGNSTKLYLCSNEDEPTHEQQKQQQQQQQLTV